MQRVFHPTNTCWRTVTSRVSFSLHDAIDSTVNRRRLWHNRRDGISCYKKTGTSSGKKISWKHSWTIKLMIHEMISWRLNGAPHISIINGWRNTLMGVLMKAVRSPFSVWQAQISVGPCRSVRSPDSSRLGGGAELVLLVRNFLHWSSPLSAPRHNSEHPEGGAGGGVPNGGANGGDWDDDCVTRARRGGGIG